MTSTSETIETIICQKGYGSLKASACAERWRIANGKQDASAGTRSLLQKSKCNGCEHGEKRNAGVVGPTVQLVVKPQQVAKVRLAANAPAPGRATETSSPTTVQAPEAEARCREPGCMGPPALRKAGNKGGRPPVYCERHGSYSPRRAAAAKAAPFGLAPESATCPSGQTDQSAQASPEVVHPEAAETTAESAAVDDSATSAPEVVHPRPDFAAISASAFIAPSKVLCATCAHWFSPTDGHATCLRCREEALSPPAEQKEAGTARADLPTLTDLPGPRWLMPRAHHIPPIAAPPAVAPPDYRVHVRGLSIDCRTLEALDAVVKRYGHQHADHQEG